MVLMGSFSFSPEVRDDGEIVVMFVVTREEVVEDETLVAVLCLLWLASICARLRVILGAISSTFLGASVVAGAAGSFTVVSKASDICVVLDDVTVKTGVGRQELHEVPKTTTGLDVI